VSEGKKWKAVGPHPVSVAATTFVLVVVACGGNARPESEEPTPSDAGSAPSDSPASTTDDSGGGGPGVGPECTVEGDRRPAIPNERADYCVCSRSGENLIWHCYGPPSDAPKPEATCSYTTVNPGTGHGSCIVSWGNCSDSRIYLISCVERVCHCIVEGKVTFQLEPRDTCPEQKADVNVLCGWRLQ